MNYVKPELEAIQLESEDEVIWTSGLTLEDEDITNKASTLEN